MNEHGTTLRNLINEKARESKPMDLSHLVTYASLDIICGEIKKSKPNKPSQLTLKDKHKG
jgi:hypothetical protein